MSILIVHSGTREMATGLIPSERGEEAASTEGEQITSNGAKEAILIKDRYLWLSRHHS